MLKTRNKICSFSAIMTQKKKKLGESIPTTHPRETAIAQHNARQSAGTGSQQKLALKCDAH